MTDREKLLSLYSQLKNIDYPSVSDELIYIPKKVSEGIDIILDWLSDEANKQFNNK